MSLPLVQAVNSAAVALRATAITPADGADLPNPATKGIWVGGTGAIKVDMVGGDTVTFNSVPVGLFRIQAKRVYATGTTATNLVALF